MQYCKNNIWNIAENETGPSTQYKCALSVYVWAVRQYFVNLALVKEKFQPPVIDWLIVVLNPMAGWEHLIKWKDCFALFWQAGLDF